MKKFKGFTLTELMVALAVIGILVAIVTPTIMKTRPNKNKMMIKKAYYTTENIVGSLINDSNLYPDMTDACVHPDPGAPASIRCAYGFEYDDPAIYSGVSYTGATKFMNLFVEKLNISANPSSNYYVTTDGMGWDFTDIAGGWVGGNTPPLPAANIRMLTIDVNGPGVGPNSLQAGAEDADDFDQFRIRIRSDGKMAIHPEDTRAIEFITINTSTTH